MYFSIIKQVIAMRNVNHTRRYSSLSIALMTVHCHRHHYSYSKMLHHLGKQPIMHTTRVISDCACAQTANLIARMNGF